MKNFEHPNEVIDKIVDLINYEYDAADYARNCYAEDGSNFDSKDLQRDYMIWSGGRLKAMGEIREGIKTILEEAL